MSLGTSHPLPNFLIVGAQRSGTTTLHHYLAQHTDILLPETRKELNFFTNQPFSQKTLDDYRAYFAHWRGERAVGEISPTYLFTSYVPGLIASQLPNIKIISILRNPPARTYSHYCYSVKGALEWLPFHQALAQEEQRLHTQWGKTGKEAWYYAYQYLSDYGLHLRRFMDVFPREQIFVTTFEKLVTAPADVLREICQFLGVDENFPFRLIARDDVQTNFGQYPLFPRFYRSLVYVRRNWADLPVLWRLAHVFKVLLPQWPLAKSIPAPDLQSRMALKTVFTPKVQALQDLVNVDFSSWDMTF